MKKITKSNKNIFSQGILTLLLLLSLIFNPLKVSAEVAETEINGELMNASSEFLRDLDFETWQLVAYKSPIFEDKLILRVIGYPGNLRIDHPTNLRVESGRKQWLLDDITLLNEDLANDGRQAAAEFDLVIFFIFRIHQGIKSYSCSYNSLISFDYFTIFFYNSR